MDLSASNYAEVNFWLRSGSDNYSEWPSSSDDLRLDVLLDNGSWQALQLWEGGARQEGIPTTFMPEFLLQAYTVISVFTRLTAQEALYPSGLLAY